MKQILILGAALAALAGSAHAETCVKDGSPQPDYYVMGSLVHPQSDSLVVGDCNKTWNQLNEAYIATPKRQAITPSYSGTGSGYGINCTARYTSSYSRSGGYASLRSSCSGY